MTTGSQPVPHARYWLNLTSENARAEQIRDELGLEADVIHYRGEQVPGRRSTQRFEWNVWSKLIADIPGSRPLAPLKPMLNDFDDGLTRLARLQEPVHRELNVSVVDVAGALSELHLDRVTVERLRRLGLCLDLDYPLYTFPADEDNGLDDAEARCTVARNGSPVPQSDLCLIQIAGSFDLYDLVMPMLEPGRGSSSRMFRSEISIRGSLFRPYLWLDSGRLTAILESGFERLTWRLRPMAGTTSSGIVDDA